MRANLKNNESDQRIAESFEDSDCLKRSELTIGLARLLTDDRSICASDSVTVWAMTSSPVIR